MNKQKLIASVCLVVVGLFFGAPALAICPVCTIAVGAGVGLSRWLGIDDAITGVWIGGLVVSTIIWTLGWLDKKQFKFLGRWLAVSVFYYAIILIPLYKKGIIGHPFNTFCYVDKLLFGITAGSIVFYAATKIHEYLKNKNGGKSYFPFQKVVMPLAFLIIASIILYIIIKCE